jgi:hypothetical protein
MGLEDAITRESKVRAIDLDFASNDRLADSRALIAAGRSASAIAAGIYALEIRLKILICQRLELESLPRAFEIHDLEALHILAGLKQRVARKAPVRVRQKWSNITQFAGRGTLNELWYSPDSHWSLTQAKEFLSWLDNPRSGVLTWLSRQK